MHFYYVYKALAHPEYHNYLTPFTLEERLMHIKEAKRTLGSTVPWLADNMNNELMAALGRLSNPELLIDPSGRVVRRRAWSDPEKLREDLEELVGPLDHITQTSDLHLKSEPPPKMVSVGVVPRLVVPDPMHALRLEPILGDTKQPFYAKLRAEVDDAFLEENKGKLYLGFHLDPLYKVHWNNLVDPLAFDLVTPAGVQVSSHKFASPPVKEAADADPREFLLDLAAEDREDPMDLTVRYFACDDADTFCVPVTQHYRVHLETDSYAGRVTARNDSVRKTSGIAGGLSDRMKRWDKNADGKISRDEAPKRLKKTFDRIDENGDGLLDPDELKSMAARRRKPASGIRGTSDY